MWFIGVEVEQETSAPLLKKFLDPPLKIHLTFVATGGVLTINAKYFTFSIPESFYC